MTFSQILRNLRREKDITQKELGEAIGKSNRVISYYENEQSDSNLPDSETLSRIANFFGVSVDYLLGIADQRSTAKIELVQKLVDLTTNKVIDWEHITTATEIPFANQYFIYQKTHTYFDPDFGERRMLIYDEASLGKAFTVEILRKSYLMYQVTNNDYLPSSNKNLYLSIFTGPNEDDILTISNSETGNLLQDLFEIVDNLMNNNENKIIRSSLDDLNSLTDPENENFDIPF